MCCHADMDLPFGRYVILLVMYFVFQISILVPDGKRVKMEIELNIPKQQ
jgi:hypothetical protein